MMRIVSRVNTTPISAGYSDLYCIPSKTKAKVLPNSQWKHQAIGNDAGIFRPEDRLFLQVAVEECQKLNLGRFSPSQGLVWTPKLPPDQCIFFRNYLFLPQSTQGRLEAEDWWALMDSELLFRNRYRRFYLPGRNFPVIFAVGFVTLIVTIGLAVAFLAPFGFNQPRSPLPAIVVVPVLAFIFFLGGLSRRRDICALRLKTDRRVFQGDRGGDLLNTLLKIQGLHLAEIEAREASRFRSRISVWPKLSRRIRNLQELKPEQPKDDFHTFQKQWGDR